MAAVNFQDAHKIGPPAGSCTANGVSSYVVAAQDYLSSWTK